MMSSDSELFSSREYSIDGEAVGQGDLKTHNPEDDPIQRPVATDRRNSAFHLTVRVVSVVHGKFKNGKLATLIVLDYRLLCTDAERRIRSMKTSLEFREVTPRPKPPTPLSKPNVVAFAPFSKPERGNLSTADVKKTRNLGFNAGASAGPANLGFNAGAGREVTHTQQYFDTGKANLCYNEKTTRFDGVWWTLDENKSQKLGIASVFRVAVLLTRATDADFTAKFLLDFDGGFRQKAGEWTDLIRGSKPTNDLLIFSPSTKEKQLQGKYDEINVDSLDDLREDITLTLPASYDLVVFPIDKNPANEAGNESGTDAGLGGQVQGAMGAALVPGG
ncbi:hypothetical protein L207DRAFT_513975 [Hyaloscypha variabilis F]|uniref:Uncharacterized protein n=1 Tax=Hyaloscypha variabilis (strain UAMH 11265 / GT02V1 / F) TaxID=1149755 RepID=A0A2J6RHS2_HYAVF|nr:hypothetical protein L207DRAFT_513975 [Hyaloscypha variabilis F]